jgi:pimeloyl-ACP methyl ester carboxylesterase
MHGLFGSSRNWTAFARRLSASHQVVTVDLRNHGNSGHADTMSYPELAADIRAFMLARGFATASLIGHSLGGKVAMCFALTHTTLVERLVVLDIAPVAYRNEYQALIESMAALPLAELTSRRHADELLAWSIPDAQLRQFLLQNLVQEGGCYRWRINLNVFKNSLAELGRFPAFAAGSAHAGPALFLGGSASDYLHPRHNQAIGRYFTNAEIRYVENAGHWLHIDQPQAVLDRITAFLS